MYTRHLSDIVEIVDFMSITPTHYHFKRFKTLDAMLIFMESFLELHPTLHPYTAHVYYTLQKTRTVCLIFISFNALYLFTYCTLDSVWACLFTKLFIFCCELHSAGRQV